MATSIFYVICFCSAAVFLTAQGYSPTTQWCYQCVSTHPGCGQPFNWWWYWSQPCPEKGDICVKIVERKGGEEVITRDCLSSIKYHRTDIPADHYEGCRTASKDVHLGNYVNNSIKELDIKRDYYSSTQFCFCYFDNRCNSSENVLPKPLLISLAAILVMSSLNLFGVL